MKQKVYIFLMLLVSMVSCQKQVDTSHTGINQVEKKFNYNRFFPETDNPAVKRILEYLKRENSKKDFLSDFVRVAGYPRWDKTLLKRSVNMQNIEVANAMYHENDTICIIPLVSESNITISGMLIAELVNEQVICHYSLLTDYTRMEQSRRGFVLSMIQLEKLVFGHTSFKVYDHLLLGAANAIHLRKRQSAINSAMGQVATTNDDPCEIVEIWHDPTEEECHCSGDEYYTGEWYYEGDCFNSPTIPFILPLGNGSSYSLPAPGIGGGGGSGTNSPPYASTFVEKLNYLLNHLDMTPESNDFLLTSQSTVNEMYHYLYNNPSNERIEIASGHIQKMAIDADYLSFVIDYHTATGNSITPWWQNQTWLDNPANFNLDITRANNEYGKLTSAEKILIASYPLQAYTIMRNVDLAFMFSEATGLPDPLNGKQDAFRHAFFQAINTRDVPSGPYSAPTGPQIVSMFAIAHESEDPPELQLEKQMDTFNNNVGISYCWNCWVTSTITIAETILNKLNNGELKYLAPLDFSISPHWPTGLNGITPSTTLKWTNQ